jgi:hypothetical protein
MSKPFGMLPTSEPEPIEPSLIDLDSAKDLHVHYSVTCATMAVSYRLLRKRTSLTTEMARCIMRAFD